MRHLFGAAVRENADSRVFAGYHFRHATDVGLAQGTELGVYVARNALREHDNEDENENEHR